MKKLIKIGLPENLAKDDYCQFHEHKYELPELATFYMEDITITNEGICLKDGNLIEQSIHWYRVKMDIYKLTGILNLIDNQTIQADDSKKHMIIQGPVFSYYHWFTESISRLMLAEKCSKEVILILPRQLKNINFVTESLTPFIFDDIIYIPKNSNLFVKQFILPQIKPYFTSYIPQITCQIRDFYRNFVNETYYSEMQKNFNRIYLLNSRCEAKKIVNEKEIICILKENNFKIINLSDYSLIEQVYLMNHAEVVVSSNQDLFACICFLRPGSKILELNNEKRNENDPYFERYWYLSSCLGLKYYYQFCDPDSPIEYEEVSELKVNINLFKKNLDILLH